MTDPSTEAHEERKRTGRDADAKHRLAREWLHAYPDGLTTDEASHRAGVRVHTAYATVAWLKRYGVVEPTGERAPTRRGSSAHVLRATRRTAAFLRGATVTELEPDVCGATVPVFNVKCTKRPGHAGKHEGVFRWGKQS